MAEMVTMAKMAIITILDINAINAIVAIITKINFILWVSKEAYGLQESGPALQNPLKYFLQIQKGKKQTYHIFPLAKTAFTPETSIEKCI